MTLGNPNPTQPLPNHNSNGGAFETQADDYSDFEDMDGEAEPRIVRDSKGLGDVFGESDQNQGWKGKGLEGGKDGADLYT